MYFNNVPGDLSLFGIGIDCLSQCNAVLVLCQKRMGSVNYIGPDCNPTTILPYMQRDLFKRGYLHRATKVTKLKFKFWVQEMFNLRNPVISVKY